MLKPEVNNYSWYVLNAHQNVDDPRLKRVKIDKDIEVRHDSTAVIVVRDRLIVYNPAAKQARVKKLKEILQCPNDLDIEENKVKIVDILRK